MHDAVVVGGGIVGASVAYHLARGGADVLLADRADGGRATDAGAGILSPATSSRTASGTWFEFAVEESEVDAFETAKRRTGAYLATGHGPTGLQLGPYSGKLVADLVLGCDPGTDLSPFSVSRFSDE